MRTTSARTARDAEVRSWPALSFHYGLSAAELARMPRCLIRVYAEELPRLLAAEQLRAVQVAVSPHLKPAQRRRLVAQLRRTADGPRARRAGAITLAEFVAGGGGGGIGVRQAS